MATKSATARKQESLKPIESITSAPSTERCVVCEESLMPGQYFALPTEYSELKRWAQGLFPGNPEDFQLFIEYIRVMNIGIEPFICSAHFAPESIMNQCPLRLFPQSTPEEYEGARISQTHKMWQRKKCIVCGAQRPSDEVYPFTQKTPSVEVWCNSMYRNDIKAAQRLLKKVVRAVYPTLCGEHFPESCFNRARELLPNSIPTFPKARTASNVMDILNKAKADLEKVLPGNYIPREDVWEKVDRAAGFVDGGDLRPKFPSKKKPKQNVVQALPRIHSIELRVDPFVGEQLRRVHKEESPLLFDSSQLVDEQIKEEDRRIESASFTGHSLEWSENLQRITVEEVPSTSTNSQSVESLSESEARSETPPPKRRPGRPRKHFPPPRQETSQPDPAVTTRFGRQVKRKVIEDYAVAERRDKTKEGVAKAHRQFVRQQREKAMEESGDGEEAGKPREKKSRTRSNRLQMHKVKCSQCGSTAEGTLHGMKEHAREHCEESLMCPFQPCDFVSTKRSRVSQHTAAEHNRWKLPIDLCETNEGLDSKINMMMERCFPTAMKRANESGSVPCTICSSVVSPDYRSLFSHACLHLPSRPFHCSECPSFESYTEDEIENHHKDAKCGGDVVSNMDDAVTSLVENLFKTAFPVYAHLLDDMYQMDANEGVEDPLPLFQSASTDPSDSGWEKKEEEEYLELPHSSQSNIPTGLFHMNGSDAHVEWNYSEEKPEIVNSVDHDHQYTAPMPLLETGLYHDLLDVTNLNVDDIGKIEM